MGPRERRTAGSVGRAVMPARDALRRDISCGGDEKDQLGAEAYSSSNCERLLSCRFSFSVGAALAHTTRAAVTRIEERIV